MKQKHLTASIYCLVAACSFGAPQPAFGEIDPAEVQDFAAKDTLRLQGQVVRAVVQNSPYVDVLDGGSLESGMSDEQRVVIQERATLNQSLVRPSYTRDTEVCGTTGAAAEVGSTEYTYYLETLRGKGPLVCIHGMWSAFKSAYSASEQSLRAALVQLNNADVRATLVDRSGCKLVCRTSSSFENMFDGNMQSIDTAFPTGVTGAPNALPTFKLLQSLGRYLREVLLVEPWAGNQGEPVLRFIGSQEVIDFLRDDAEVRTDHRYMAAGQYDLGRKPLVRYLWEGPYRGYSFGVDPQPLRFNEIDPSTSQPIFIEPEISVEVDNKVGSRPNPLWVRARYEVALVMGKMSFQKLAPESYTGEGSFKFPAQGFSGELKWKNIEDNDQNFWADFGQHQYQFRRAYKPIRPHAVCAIAYARQSVDFGLSAITSFGDYSATGSL